MMKRKSLEWLSCSEAELTRRIGSLRGLFVPGVLCVLEGEMGAGKSAFAREVLRMLCPGAVSKGSPTFPLVHEYRADSGFTVHHIDLYRLKSEREFEDSGIAEQIDSRDAVVLVEWASLFPDFFEAYLSQKSRRSWIRVWIHPGNGPDTRSYRFEVSGDLDLDLA